MSNMSDTFITMSDGRKITLQEYNRTFYSHIKLHLDFKDLNKEFEYFKEHYIKHYVTVGVSDVYYERPASKIFMIYMPNVMVSYINVLKTTNPAIFDAFVDNIIRKIYGLKVNIKFVTSNDYQIDLKKDIMIFEDWIDYCINKSKLAKENECLIGEEHCLVDLSDETFNQNEGVCICSEAVKASRELHTLSDLEIIEQKYNMPIENPEHYVPVDRTNISQFA